MIVANTSMAARWYTSTPSSLSSTPCRPFSLNRLCSSRPSCLSSTSWFLLLLSAFSLSPFFGASVSSLECVPVAPCRRACVVPSCFHCDRRVRDFHLHFLNVFFYITIIREEMLKNKALVVDTTQFLVIKRLPCVEMKYSRLGIP